ncbi:hypothetical protein [Nonlabens sp.]|uniref:hypothetical protein n=1 Tax=Nonlabens sp. TaxID=1888209 RepID=UPI001BD08ED6|nr:hypothetical protein [Nonlabens sp.]
MKYLYYLCVFSILFTSCDDPSLDQQNNGTDGEVVPIRDLVRLSSIQVAQNVMANITENVSMVYNEEELISQVSFIGTTNVVYDFEYTANNRLITATKVAGSPIVYNFTYTSDSVFLDYTDSNGEQVQKQLYIDLQNRINRIVTRITNGSGITTQTEDLRYQYTTNFNVSRIDRIDINGSTLMGYSEFTYELNNNPFRDMNDVLRLIIFPEFIPYTRYLPSSRIDYTSVSGNFIADRSFLYRYSLQEDLFPNAREITKTESGFTATTFEFFNYL